MYKRYSKVALIWAVALFASLVVFNNITDYGVNYGFVSHVLNMDTTFPNNKCMWRSIDSSILYHAAYLFIIMVEATVAFLCWVGGYHLFKFVNNVNDFNRAKKYAIIGLTLGILLFFTGFITIAGEWFLMWQSKVWNGQDPAFRLTAIFGLVLIYLVNTDTKEAV